MKANFDLSDLARFQANPVFLRLGLLASCLEHSLLPSIIPSVALMILRVIYWRVCHLSRGVMNKSGVFTLNE